MKIGIITDQHFGARKGSTHFHEYFQKFYDDTFFPAIDREGITTLIDMGDTFDNRRSIDLWSLKWAKENYFDIIFNIFKPSISTSTINPR